MVQSLSDEKPADDEEESYISVECLACNRVHIVDKETGKVVGLEEG